MSDDKTGNKTPAEILPLRPPRPCPICGKPSVRAYYPFSSKRCADIDLNRWLSGAYVLTPAPEEDSESDASTGDGGESES